MSDTNPTEQFSGTKDVADSHKFDEAKLAAWMEANVEGYKGPLEVRQFKGGQSNPTYQLVTPDKKYVMRRKPPGKLLPSAHAVDREYRVIAALYPLGFPVARPTASAKDESVVGTMFYIMDMVEGRILWDATLPDYSPPSAARSSTRRSPPSPRSTMSTGRPPASKASARKATTSPARSTAGPSNTRCPRPPRSRRWTS
jgi:hypothetical protein